MKKIPTLFERHFENHNVVEVLSNVAKGFEWVLDGDGVATVKFDGACCAIIDGEFYKRYDAKHGKSVPEGAIRCQPEPDPITGHLPCWVKCDRNNPSDKWFWSAYDLYSERHEGQLDDRTYEAVGLHFQNNPYSLEEDILIPHGLRLVTVPRSFEGIKEYLRTNEIEGLVFWKDDQPQCKIKRKDFGFEWPVKHKEVL